MRHGFTFAIMVCVLLVAHEATAQVLGTFRWQFQPYCNVVTLTVELRDQAYLLTGFDDQCGGAARAAASGIATPNPNGTISLGLTILTATGVPAHVNAVVSPVSISGTWQDADGNAGGFAFNPGAVAGGPRPAPRVLVTPAQIAPGAVGTAAIGGGSVTADKLAPSALAGNGSATTLARSDHTHDDRYYTTGQADVAFLPRVAVGQRGLIGHAEVFSAGTAFRYQSLSNGLTATVSKGSAGFYFLTFPGFGTGGGFNQTILVSNASTTSSTGWRNCGVNLRGINGGTGTLTVTVLCVDSTFVPADANFFIFVVS